MNRLTTNEEYPHGAEGVSEDKLTGKWCRGKFECTACPSFFYAQEEK